MPGFHVFDANILKTYQLKIKHLGVANSIIFLSPESENLSSIQE